MLHSFIHSFIHYAFIELHICNYAHLHVLMDSLGKKSILQWTSIAKAGWVKHMNMVVFINTSQKRPPMNSIVQDKKKERKERKKDGKKEWWKWKQRKMNIKIHFYPIVVNQQWEETELAALIMTYSLQSIATWDGIFQDSWWLSPISSLFLLSRNDWLWSSTTFLNGKTKTDFCGLVMLLVLSVCLLIRQGHFPANRIKPAVF